MRDYTIIYLYVPVYFITNLIEILPTATAGDLSAY